MYIDDTYIYIGNSPDALNLEIPFPTVGDIVFQTKENSVKERNANGVLVGQKTAEDTIIQTIGWTYIEVEKWWEINEFFQKNGDVFYCKFFNQNIGEWQIKKFWRGDTSCSLLLLDENGKPEYYEDANFEIESVGE